MQKVFWLKHDGTWLSWDILLTSEPKFKKIQG